MRTIKKKQPYHNHKYNYSLYTGAFLSVYILLFLLLMPLSVLSKTIKVAVIDTGFGITTKESTKKLCKYGHKDFSKENVYFSTKDIKNIPMDNTGHGTNVTGLIEKYAGDSDYCMIIIKYYNKKNNLIDYSNKSIEYATKIGADIINYSSGGSFYKKSEHIVVKNFLDNGGTFVAAAGNFSENIDKIGFYPASLDRRIIVVGSKSVSGLKEEYSNYGYSVDVWELGRNLTANEITKSGTSQSTAVHTGKLIKKLNNKK